MGEWLVRFRRRADAAEAEWLDMLARFDIEQGWAADGQLSCADWLAWRAGMGRATCYDRLRVAHELRRRPVIADALAAGRVSYCAVRAMTRAEGTTPSVDEALVAVAEAGSVADVEAVVRSYRLYRSQDLLPPTPAPPARGLRIRPAGEGTVRVEAILTDIEGAEFEAALRHATDPQPPVDESSREDSSTGDDGRIPWPEARADALMTVTRAALTARSAGAPGAAGADRYMVHVVIRKGESRLLGGSPLTPADRDRITCDCSHVLHAHDSDGVPLTVGRRQRTWSAGQRRAVLVRDSGRCRWPGCHRTQVDIHHLLPWQHGGRTDIDNAAAICPQHHTKLHSGYHTTGTPHGTLHFHRPDGTPLGTTTTRPLALAV